eukprot:7056980-Pyramimonas_sp.AAC.1
MQVQVRGVEVRVVDLLIKLPIILQTGFPGERCHLHKQFCSPNPCKDPTAALMELRRWFGPLTRAVDIGTLLPGLEQLYRGARAIYSG